ncbi:nuclear transport factor 2 family protein [Derxia gummosa]|uniref:Nuclear transport factor 2 family protein n=1 Tax=Derxia gummosa DSM 723 TaxID=1121388 RepID=A0A8B6X9N1_9BURK|nr:nuclear transport factor 2 family protein [Derxia gummosa]
MNPPAAVADATHGAPASADRLAQLEARLARFEAEHAIRACLKRYMALCDALDAATPLDELASLFTRGATWAGKGGRYGATFGGYAGRDEIAAMFRRYMRTPAHFAFNAHFLTSELIEVESEGRARGGWLMLQTSTFASGASQLSAARLSVGFAVEDGRWRIDRFETEALFSRPVDHWDASAPLPVPAADA